MNRELTGQLVALLGTELVDKCYAIAGSIPVSFATLRKEIRISEIEKAIGEKKSDHFIARLMNVNERTLRRHRSNLRTKK